MRESPADDGGRRPGGFTLLELVVVMVVLAIAAGLVVPHMASFFRGRLLHSEARRLLAVTRYAQSRAVAEGVPVLLWIDSARSSYGLVTQSGAADPDDRTSTFAVDPSLTLKAVAPQPPPTSEEGDERLGAPDNLPAIRFMPDGWSDPSSVARIVISEGAAGALEIRPSENGLEYEIQAPSQP
jgi:type II secretion system protein H